MASGQASTLLLSNLLFSQNSSRWINAGPPSTDGGPALSQRFMLPRILTIDVTGLRHANFLQGTQFDSGKHQSGAANLGTGPYIAETDSGTPIRSWVVLLQSCIISLSPSNLADCIFTLGFTSKRSTTPVIISLDHLYTV